MGLAAGLAQWGLAPPRSSTPGPEGPGTRAAPLLSVRGQTLTWTAVPGVSAYELLTKVPGRPDRSSVLSGTSVTPRRFPAPP